MSWDEWDCWCERGSAGVSWDEWDSWCERGSDDVSGSVGVCGVLVLAGVMWGNDDGISWG